jgi:hypothetical protein
MSFNNSELAAALSHLKRRQPEARANEAQLADSLANEKARNARLRACDLEAWYDRLKSFTFPTLFVPLSPDEARSMITIYHEKKRNGSFCEPASVQESYPSLAALAGRIDEAIAQLLAASSDKRGVFAKLSSRSPKDSRMCEARAFENVKEQLCTRFTDKALSVNELYSTVLSCGIQSLRLSDATEVLEAFLTSDRVCEDDLPLALEFPNLWSQHIVIRQWMNIPTFCEFRGFVIANKLTGLSQYFSGAFFPELVENKDRILELIIEFFERVKSHVALEPAEYVVDFAVELEQERVYVIELNPFGPPDGMGTGTPLFSLANAADRAILFGDAPFEFRIEEQPPIHNVNTLLRQGPLREWLAERGFLQALQ